MFVLFLFLIFCASSVQSLRPSDLFPYKVPHQYSNASCINSYGSYPSWLKGVFVRQTCGAFGNQDDPQPPNQPPTNIRHFFDCLGMVSTFRFDGSPDAKYSNRFYNNHAYKVLESQNFSFEKSGVAWQTVFSPFNAKNAAKYVNNWTEADGYYTSGANVNFWEMTSRPDGSGSHISEAMDESKHGLMLDVVSLEMFGPYKYADSLEKGRILIGNPAHGAVDEKGIRWSTIGNYKFTSKTTGSVSLLIYTIENNARVIQGEYKIGDFDLGLCHGSYKTVYPNFDDMLGYIHSFVLTPNYVAVPLSSLGWNFCGIFFPSPESDPGNWFFKATTYQETKVARFLIFDRNSKKFVADIPMDKHVLPCHQSNWYEDADGKIIADMNTYEYSVYSHLYINNILTGFKEKTIDGKFQRFVIDIKNNKVDVKTFPLPDPSIEFPRVNEAYRYKPYQYSYMVGKPFSNSSSIFKYDVVNSRVAARWGPFPGIYPGEPIFVQAPNAVDEDDGVILVGGLDASISGASKGIVAVLNAKTLETLYQGHTPQSNSLGLHNYFSHQPDFGEGQ